MTSSELAVNTSAAPAILHALEVEVTDTVAGVSPDQWDATVGDGHLSSTHRWTLKLEKDGRKARPVVFLVRRRGELVAAAQARRTNFSAAAMIPGGTWKQFFAALPFFPPLQRPSALVFLKPWTFNTGLSVRPGVDPEEVAPALHRTFREQGVGALVTMGIPFAAHDSSREMTRIAMGGSTFPLLQNGYFPPMQAGKYFENLPGKRRRELKYNRQRAEEAGYHVEFSKDVSGDAQMFADLVANTRVHHWAEGRFVPPVPNVLCRAPFYRWVHRNFPGDVELAKAIAKDGSVAAAFIMFHGPLHTSLFTYGMQYPPPEKINLYSYLTGVLVEKLGSPTRAIDFGTFMHEAKRLCGAQMQPLLARVSYTNPTLAKIFDHVIAPRFMPRLDYEHWDSVVGTYRWLARLSKWPPGARFMIRAIDRKQGPSVFDEEPAQEVAAQEVAALPAEGGPAEELDSRP